MSDIDRIIEWAKEKPERSVSIEVRNKVTRIWVFDYVLLVGQFVEKFDDINLEEQKKKNDLEELKRLNDLYGYNRDGV